MNSAVPLITQFVDLQAQYSALKEQIDSRIHKVLEHGQFIMGPEVRELEEKLAHYVGSKHCVTCASGTEALLIALMALKIGPGDEVITTPFTFAATAEVIVLLGAKPVFVDIEPDTCNINASLIRAAITSQTRAIIPVSLYGQPCDMDEINEVAAENGLAVIEDAAQSFGALYKGRKSCNLSTIGCTSFFPSKPLGCYGDGGAMFTNVDSLAQAMREIRAHGQERRYYHTRIGVGGRMDTIQCAVLLAKLDSFDWEVEQRIKMGNRYTHLLSSARTDIKLMTTKQNRTNVFAQYTVMAPMRNQLQTALRHKGIPTAIHYPLPLHKQPAYEPYGRGSILKESEKAAELVISLPMSAFITIDQQDAVVSALLEA